MRSCGCAAGGAWTCGGGGGCGRLGGEAVERACWLTRRSERRSCWEEDVEERRVDSVEEAWLRRPRWKEVADTDQRSSIEDGGGRESEVL